MTQQERYLLQQVQALRKENDVYRVEFRELRAEIKNYKDLLRNSDQRNRNLEKSLSQQATIQATNKRFQQENKILRKDLAALSNKLHVRTTKAFHNLSGNQKRTIRHRLKAHFHKCLQAIDDWTSVVIRLKFNEDFHEDFWEAVFYNAQTDINIPSEPIFRKHRWTNSQMWQMVYVTDKFMISNEAYHELHMVSEGGLPTSYQFKEFKNDMSQSIDIRTSTTPGMDAASRSIRDILSDITLPESTQGRYFIKFSADGAVVASNRFAVTGCFKIYNSDNSGKPKEFTQYPYLLDEYPVFYYFGEESTEVLRDEASHCFAELMELQRNGIVVKEKQHEVKVLITCDWKCLCSLQGINGPSSTYFCIFCTVTKQLRYLFLETDVDKWTISRSNEERLLCLGTNNSKGYSNDPLLDIDFRQCPVDFLHLCNGVISKQLNQVVCWVLDQGNEHRLLDEMKRIKVPFKFFTEKSSDSRNSILKWSSPSMRNLRIIYEHLQLEAVLDPGIDKSLKALQNLKVEELRYYCKKNKLSAVGKKDDLVSRLKVCLGNNAKVRSLRKVGSILREATTEEVGEVATLDINGLQNMWSEGNRLLNEIRDGVDDITKLKQDLLRWGVSYMKLTFAEDVTPYIHTFVFHCPEFVSMYGGLGAFSMEEVERLNKINKSCFFRKTHQGSDPNASSWQVMRLWNRSSFCRSRETAREGRKEKFFRSRKRNTYNAEQSSDEWSD